MGEKPDYKEQIKQQFKNMDSSGGITKGDAVVIAQNYIVDKGIDKNCVITRPKITDKGWSIPDGCWEISFKATANIRRKQGLEWFSVFIDKSQGTIKGSGWSPDL